MTHKVAKVVWWLKFFRAFVLFAQVAFIVVCVLFTLALLDGGVP